MADSTENTKQFLDKAGLESYHNSLKGYISAIATSISADGDQTVIDLIPDKIFSAVQVGDNQVQANGKTTTLKFKAGENIALAASDTDKTITITSTAKGTEELVTTTTKGLMSPTDKAKLDAIEAGANNYTLPKATTTTLGGIIVGANLSAAYQSNGTIDVTSAVVEAALGYKPLESISVFTGATTSADGTTGIVPAPAKNDTSKYLKADGTWSKINLTDSTEGTLAANRLTGYISTDRIPELDASKITSGTLNIERIPATAIERCVVVSTEVDKLALTSNQIQIGDTVKVENTKRMYRVIDDSKLGTEDAFTEYVSSADWSTITGIPTTLAGMGITDKWAAGVSQNGPAVNVAAKEGTSNTSSYVYFADEEVTYSGSDVTVAKPNYSSNLTYNPSENVLSVGTLKGVLKENSTDNVDDYSLTMTTASLPVLDSSTNAVTHSYMGYLKVEGTPASMSEDSTEALYGCVIGGMSQPFIDCLVDLSAIPSSETLSPSGQAFDVYFLPKAHEDFSSFFGSSDPYYEYFGAFATVYANVYGVAAHSETSDLASKVQHVLNFNFTGGESVEFNGSEDISITASTLNVYTKGETYSKTETDSQISSAVSASSTTLTSLIDSTKTTLENRLTSVEGRVTTAEGNITTLQSNVSTINTTLSSKQDSSTAVTHTASTAVGTTNQPVYISPTGVAKAIAFTIASNVPANAKFTDTTYSVATTTSNGLLSKEDKVKLDLLSTSDIRSLENNFIAKNTFSAGGTVTADSTEGAGAVNLTNGGLWVADGIKGNKVYNAVWNDLADCIPVDDEAIIEPGYCYCFDGEHYYKSTKYMEAGAIGIQSDTYGFHMGSKPNTKQMDVAVAGFVLAYVDKEYPVGTALTCTKGGYLTKMEHMDKVEWPERIVATFWKVEKEEEWGPEKQRVKVNNRMWVKVR